MLVILYCIYTSRLCSEHDLICHLFELILVIHANTFGDSSHHQHEGASNGLSSKGHLKAMSTGTWEAWHKEDVKFQA
jgi:hypothetical protein